jgi:hypothetical protein
MPFGVNFSEVMQLVKTGASIEAQVKLIELQGEMLAVEAENQRFRNRIAELEAEMEVRGAISFESPYYWLDNGGKRDGPFCQACRDGQGKLVRLQSDYPGNWHCTICRNHFRDRNWRPFEMVQARD